MTARTWKHLFVVEFVSLLRGARYEGDDIVDVAYQHADASWPMRDTQHADPTEAAKGEYDALCDSV